MTSGIVILQISGTNGVFKYDMVCPATNSARVVLSLGHPRAVRARGLGGHDYPYSCQRAYRQPGEDAADQANEIQR